MKISIILAHPRAASFNHAIAQTAAAQLKKNGHDVRMHDLYQEKFDPLLSPAELTAPSADPLVQRHAAEITEADGIVIVHPNWWGQPPAMLKGWVDRVLCMGVAYRFTENDKGEGVPVGLLKARTAVLFNTSNTPADREQAVFGDPLDNLWKRCILDFCGIKNVHRAMFGVVIVSTPAQRETWLEEVRATLNKYFPPD
ncbi:MAG TPA: NAD(P)H-dependent oxidoreductase [Elusimicrobiota bacterium]|nr:NAD(P)H-dependent oxidoreductase [Elusimicrobiota bacterium]